MFLQSYSTRCIAGEGNGRNDAYRKDIKAGRYSSSDTRYSFFRIFYRNINEDSFVASNNIYGIRSATGG